MNDTARADLADDASDSMTSVISDVEEEGELHQPHEDDETPQSIGDAVIDQITDGDCETDDTGEISGEIAAAAARYLGIIEAAMRQHQSNGTAPFVDDEDQEDATDDATDPADGAFNDSLIVDMLQDPSIAFAATIQSNDRRALLSLLTN